MKLHFIDTETSHLDCNQGEITEIAIITYCLETRKESRYVKKIKMQYPERANKRSLEIGNYNEDIWSKEGFFFYEISEDISRILNNGIIVAHNVNFDYNYLLSEFKRYNDLLRKKDRLKITYKTFDTKNLVFEHLYPYLSSTSMDKVRGFFGWSKENSHTALKDAIDCQKLFFTLNKCSWLKRTYYVAKNYISKKTTPLRLKVYLYLTKYI